MKDTMQVKSLLRYANLIEPAFPQTAGKVEPPLSPLTRSRLALSSSSQRHVAKPSITVTQHGVPNTKQIQQAR